MNYHVYRKTRLVDGKLVKDRVYRGRYRLEDQSKRTDVALNTSDKRVAEQRLEQIVREKQMEASGIIPPEAIRKAAKSPLQEHLAQYVADLTALKRDDQYVYELKNRINRLIRECGWNQLKDITPDSFQTWRAKQTLSGKTLNEYLTSVCSLLNWMEKQERINRNPLRHVEKVPTNGVKVRPRRAYSGTELEKLLEVAGDNRVVYLTAVYTGLRRGELAALEPEDVHLDAAKPFLNVRASTTKSRKQATIALHGDVVMELSEHMAKLPPSAERVFDGYMPTMEQLKAHLALAGIDFLDRKNRRVDFHSLRHTLNTKLAIAGVAPRVAMEIMRHSDMRLTAQTYTDLGLLPMSEAVIDLPSVLGKKETRAPRRAPDSVETRHDLTNPDTTDLGISRLDLSENKQLTQEMDCPVQTGQNLEMVRGTGFEPVTPTVSM